MTDLSLRKNTTLQDLLFLVPLSLIFLLFRLGSGSVASWDEALYASVSREVAESGRWLRLTFGGDLWFDKPPLALWATALLYQAFGVSEFTARLFSSLCGFGTVLLTYFLGRQLFNRWTALCGAMILLSSSHFLRFARFGMLDSPFTFFLVLALYLFWLGQSRDRYLVFSGVAVGLAAMTKGFAGILIFPILWIYCVWSERLDILKRPSYWIGVAVAALVALPWHAYQLIMFRDQFFNGVVLQHLIHRTTSAIEGHSGNAYFYVRVLVNKYHPWILIGIFSAPIFLWKAARKESDESIFLAAWMFFYFAVVTAIRTKLPWYIFPVYPALSLTAAYFLVKIFTEKYALFVKLFFVAVLALHGFYSQLYEMDYSRPIKALAPVVARSVPEGERIYFYRYHEQPAAMFYLRRMVAYLESPGELEAALKKGKVHCLLNDRELPALQDVIFRHRMVVTGSSSGYSVLASAK